MTVVIRKNFDPLFEAASYMLRFSAPRPGSSAKDTALQIARWSSEREGLFIGLALIASKERVDACRFLPQDAWIEAVASHDVRSWWDGIEKRWIAGEWGGVDDSAFAIQLRSEWLDELVMSEKLRDQNEAERRKLVLAGKVDPTLDDEPWIKDELQTFDAVSNPYKQALQRLAHQKRAGEA